MIKRLRKVIVPLVLAAAIVPLGGCELTTSVEDLLTLPQLSLEYTGLSRQIESLIAEGYEYASPTNGQNIQSVQMVDLDGDGSEEAVAFFRKSVDEKPLKIVVFRPEEETYNRLCTIESSGSAVESVSYQDLNGDGVKELIVGWKISADVQTVAVYEVSSQSVTLMQSSYISFVVQEPGTAGPEEKAGLVVLRSNAEGNTKAELYQWENDALAAISGCELSSSAAELNHGGLVSGKLDDGTDALFVTGVNEQNVAVTDILAYTPNGLNNVAGKGKTGHSDVSYPFRQLLPQDIDGDGAIELPMLHEASGDKQMDGVVSWFSFGSNGEMSWSMDSYHSQTSGWYFAIPDAWHERVTSTVLDSGSVESQVLLCLDGDPVAALYTISGENRENRAARGDRFVLKQQTAVIYAGELLSESGAGELDEAAMRERFHPIVSLWN